MGDTIRFTMAEWRLLFPTRETTSALSKHDKQCALDWQAEAGNTFQRISEARAKLESITHDAALMAEFKTHINRLMRLSAHASARARQYMGLE